MSDVSANKTRAGKGAPPCEVEAYALSDCLVLGGRLSFVRIYFLLRSRRRSSLGRSSNRIPQPLPGTTVAWSMVSPRITPIKFEQSAVNRPQYARYKWVHTMHCRQAQRQSHLHRRQQAPTPSDSASCIKQTSSCQSSHLGQGTGIWRAGNRRTPTSAPSLGLSLFPRAFSSPLSRAHPHTLPHLPSEGGGDGASEKSNVRSAGQREVRQWPGTVAVYGSIEEESRLAKMNLILSGLLA
jgi:hypothetical protein